MAMVVKVLLCALHSLFSGYRETKGAVPHQAVWKEAWKGAVHADLTPRYKTMTRQFPLILSIIISEKWNKSSDIYMVDWSVSGLVLVVLFTSVRLSIPSTQPVHSLCCIKLDFSHHLTQWLDFSQKQFCQSNKFISLYLRGKSKGLYLIHTACTPWTALQWQQLPHFPTFLIMRDVSATLNNT